MTNVNVKNVDKDVKLKASFVLKTKGKDLSTAVREMLDKYAKEYDDIYVS